MVYDKQSWRNGDPTTPLSASRLLHMEDGIAAALTGILAGDGNVTITNNGGVVTIDVAPEVEPDPQRAQTPVVVLYGTNLSTLRPATDRVVLWYGTGLPVNAIAGDIVNSTTAIIGQPGGGDPEPEPFTGMLEAYATPFRAHSLRRLSGLYTGPAVTVGRSADATTLDVGFLADGTLDTAALLAFAGSGSAHVMTFYDQSGNGRHLIAASAATAPKIVNAGALVTLSSKPAMVFDGVDDVLTSAASGLYAAGSATLAIVGAAPADTADTFFAEVGSSAANSWRVRIGAGGVSPLFRLSATASGTSQYSIAAAAEDLTFNGAAHHLFLVESANLVNYWRDTVQTMTNVAAPRGTNMFLEKTSLGAAAYGTTPTGFAAATVQELIGWPAAMPNDRAAISASQRSFWGLA